MFTVVYTAVFFLNSLPFDDIEYATILCIFFGLIFAIVDFWRYYKKHRLLFEQFNRISLSIDDLPSPDDILEIDYQNLISNLNAAKMQLSLDYDNSKSDMIDYYTLWAHQIKTPIAAMRLLLQIHEDEGSSELVRDVSAELFKIEQYVEMVLQYLRLESPSTDYVIKKYNIDSIIKQAVRKYAKIFINKKISFYYTDLNTEVLTDEKWLVFVIEQILSNALKYTSEGNISIYMEGGSTLVIADTGIGIKEEDLPRVFEKGFTGYNGRSDKKSTGIGLYLCKRILKKLSHPISIESEVGKGTRVKIRFDLDYTRPE